MIQIYNPDNTDFDKNGDMTIFPSSAIVHAILNESWEAEMVHPIDKEDRWKYIQEDAVVKLPSFNGNQLFRIKSKEKSDSGVTCKMEPIFFDSIGDCFLEDVRPTAKNGQEALDLITAPNKKYSGKSNITRTATAYYQYKNLMQAINGDDTNSFINRWGGEILFDNFKIIINDRVGGDYGVELRYGKNIPQDGLTEQIDTRDIVTRIYPKAYNGYTMTGNGHVDSTLINNYPTIKAKTITFDNVKMAADAQEDDSENGVIICNTQGELDAALKKKCEEQYAAGADKPKVTISADMVLLQNTDLYADYKMLEEVSIGDTIHCRHSRLGIVTDARVIELEFDSTRKKVTSVVLGDFQYDYFKNVSSSINKIDQAINQDGSIMAEKISGFINGAMASLKAQYNVAKKQDVLAILFENLDEDSPMYGALAIGTQGILISKERTEDGKSWEWTTAMTASGLMAGIIVAGILSDKTGRNYWNLDTGEFALSSTASTIDGKPTGDVIDDALNKSKKYSEEKLNDFVSSTYNSDIANLQSQIDGQIETFYYDYEPSLSNIPASRWTTEEDRQKHEGDLFYWKSKGYAYRFFKDGSTWKWQLVKDTDVTKAIADAAEAQDTADSKRRVFIATPVPPYDDGDLWVTSTKSADAGIKICITARASGSYASSDWIDLKYVDSSSVNDAITSYDESLGQTDIFNKLTNGGKVKGIYLQDGELYINASYIGSGVLSADRVDADAILAKMATIGGWKITDEGLLSSNGAILLKSDGTIANRSGSQSQFLFYNPTDGLGVHKLLVAKDCDFNTTGGSSNFKRGATFEYDVYVENNSGSTRWHIAPNTDRGTIYDDCILKRTRDTYLEATYNQSTSNGSYVRVVSGGLLYSDSSSSKRYKDHVRNMNADDIQKLYEIPVVWFKYKDGILVESDTRNGKEIPGFYAEDIETYFPIAADYKKDTDGNLKVETWNARIIVPAMMKMIQEQKKEIDFLKSEIEYIKSVLKGDA